MKSLDKRNTAIINNIDDYFIIFNKKYPEFINFINACAKIWPDLQKFQQVLIVNWLRQIAIEDGFFSLLNHSALDAFMKKYRETLINAEPQVQFYNQEQLDPTPKRGRPSTKIKRASLQEYEQLMTYFAHLDFWQAEYVKRKALLEQKNLKARIKKAYDLLEPLFYEEMGSFKRQYLISMWLWYYRIEYPDSNTPINKKLTWGILLRGIYQLWYENYFRAWIYDNNWHLEDVFKATILDHLNNVENHSLEYLARLTLFYGYYPDDLCNPTTCDDLLDQAKKVVDETLESTEDKKITSQIRLPSAPISIFSEGNLPIFNKY